MRRYVGIAAIAMVAIAAGLVAACNTGGSVAHTGGEKPAVDLVVLPPGAITYSPPGEYLENGYPATPPAMTARFEHGVQIAKRQVSQAEYAACVEDGACKRLDRGFRDGVAPDVPAIGISWRDATAYAQWLTRRTGEHYRLPTYAEWIYAAGSAYKEDANLGPFDPADPAQRWLAEYAQETQRKAAAGTTAGTFGSGGENEWGLLDIGGAVWDWTDTCHTRQRVDLAAAGKGTAVSSGDNAAASENCGIRVVAGAHRSYITDFIRDPKAGACSVGVPPSNLGFRLVRDSVVGQSKTLRERLGLS